MSRAWLQEGDFPLNIRREGKRISTTLQWPKKFHIAVRKKPRSRPFLFILVMIIRELPKDVLLLPFPFEKCHMGTDYIP